MTAAILEGKVIPGLSRASGPLALATTTIYVPTQRAARALQDAFRQQTGGVLLLPRIVPLGAIDESETRAIFDPPDPDADIDVEIAPAIGALARRMELMQLVLGWGRAVAKAIISIDADGQLNLDPEEPLLVATTPADSWNLAQALADLIDEMIVEDIPFARLKPLTQGLFDEYWRITLDFLAIAGEAWPAHLAEKGLVDPARRQAQLIARDIARLQRTGMAGQGGPVIVAGSTGAHKATARLMAAIARAPQGAIVLPGLDLRLEDSAFAQIGDGDADNGGSGHPQAGFQRLLAMLEQTRHDFRPLGETSPALLQRRIFLSEAMRPAESTNAWRDRDAFISGDNIDLALAGVTLIDAAHEGEEALAIAIALRHVLETPGKTAALITPDRDLVRRVRSHLLRWDIRIADSAGEPLTLAQAGSLALLALDCATPQLEAAPLLALLTHPLTRMGRPRAETAALLEALETGLLRGTLVPGALQDAAALVAEKQREATDRHAHPAKARITPSQWTGLRELLERVHAALVPLVQLPADAVLKDWLAAHETVVQALLAGPPDAVAQTGHDLAQLQGLFTASLAAATPRFGLNLPDYQAFFRRLASECVVAQAGTSHERLAVYGLLEARLLPADLLVLGGLDEGVWPPQADSGPFLNRPMRAALGLTPPERRIGQTALDFVTAMGAAEVILSRARKRTGSPTVASRFLQRMAAVAGQKSWDNCTQRGALWLHYAHRLDHGPLEPSIARPAPVPPLHLRPTRLSVTQVETLRRDPYGIYAQHILKLSALEQLGLDYTSRDFGSWIHDALRLFGERYASGPLPATAAAELELLARAAFGPMAERPEFQTFHWPRIARSLNRFLAWEAERRGGLVRLHAETRGGLDIDLPDGTQFHLSARADRIEQRDDGSLAIVDYKTGSVPAVKDVIAGFSPQLPLEAAIALQGGFAAQPKAAIVSELLHLKIGDSAKSQHKPALGKNGNIAVSAREQLLELTKLLDDFRNPLRSYPSRPFPANVPRYSDYNHLARVKEWGSSGDEDDGGDEGEAA